jgi:hypothetical protein
MTGQCTPDGKDHVGDSSTSDAQDSATPPKQKAAPEQHPRLWARLGGCLKLRRKEINLWVDTMSKLAQVFAFLLAGIWTYMTFVLLSAPSLESKLIVKSSLSWSAVNEKSCQGAFHVSVKNEGLGALDVERIGLRAWVIDPQVLTASAVGESPRLIDFDQIRSTTEPFYDASPEPIRSDVTGHYAGGMENDSEVTFLFTKSPHRLVVFWFEVEGNKSAFLRFLKGPAVSNYTWQSDGLCGDNAAQ